MIAKITRAYVRHYSDNDQTTAYVEWINHEGKPGRTEGPVRAVGGGTLAKVYGSHMGALIARAICTGVDIEHETCAKASKLAQSTLTRAMA